MINTKIESIENLMRSNLAEVNTFLHTVHGDFENFLSKHKKEHTSMNMRLLKVTEDMANALQQVKPIKQTVD